MQHYWMALVRSWFRLDAKNDGKPPTLKMWSFKGILVIRDTSFKTPLYEQEELLEAIVKTLLVDKKYELQS